MVVLFPEIDKKQTKGSVHKLLSNYRSMVRIAGESHFLKVTSEYQFEVKHSTKQSTGNVINRKYLAEAELTKIIDAMNQLDIYDRQLLYDKYMDHNFTTNIAIYMKHHMSESKFYRELEKAMLRFAEAYDGGQLLVEK